VRVLAEAAIEMEKQLRNLSQEQLDDKYTIKELLIRCIGNKDNIKALASDDIISLIFEQLCDLVN